MKIASLTLFLALSISAPAAKSEGVATPPQHDAGPVEVTGNTGWPASGPHGSPRRAFVGTDTKEYAFARYVEDCVAKVERIGNLNYPEAARTQGIYGSLMLTVSIYANGELEKIELDRSSGSRILDDAAVRIVELAAPFAPFPDEMRRKADILSITRTWTFIRSNHLVETD